MPRRKRAPIDQDPPINDQDPIDQDPVEPTPEPEQPPLDDGRGDTAEVVVMAQTNIVLPSQASERRPEGKVPFRTRCTIPREEYEAICELDRRAGREMRLMEI